MPVADVAAGLAGIAALTGAGIAVNAIAPGWGTAIAVAPGVFGVFARERTPDTSHVAKEVAGRVAKHDTCCRALPKGWRGLPLDELRRKGAEVDATRLPHPSQVGFQRTRLAAQMGQKADWAYRLPDRSRLHAHEFADGKVLVHRDRLDPALGAYAAVEHYVTEGPGGKLVLAALLMGTVGATVWWGLRE